MGDQKPTSDAPIWHKPIWITAIVSLISVFFTVPEIVGQYLVKEQDIELAKEKTEALRLGNLEFKQKQEFGIVDSTLSKQGSERVFMLRYLAATLDDKEARKWAEKEVDRLDALASQQQILEQLQNEILLTEKSLEEGIPDANNPIKGVLEWRQQALDAKLSEVAKLRKEAGIADEGFH